MGWWLRGTGVDCRRVADALVDFADNLGRIEQRMAGIEQALYRLQATEPVPDGEATQDLSSFIRRLPPGP
jgi:hypothetical protein